MTIKVRIEESYKEYKTSAVAEPETKWTTVVQAEAGDPVVIAGLLRAYAEKIAPTENGANRGR